MARLAALGSPRRSGSLRGGVLAGIGLMLLAIPVAAQSYPRLHVIALSQRADRAAVAPHDIFRVTIHITIAERRQRLDELILGTFANCEIISNETVRTAAGSGGTDFVERLTLEALAPGEATITPAYIDALDPTIGKPMRFSSNAIRVQVTGGAPLDRGVHALVDAIGRLATAAAIGVGVVAAVFVLGVIFIRRRRRRPAAAQPVPAVSPPVPAAPAAPAVAGDRLAEATAAYRARRSDAALRELRGVLFMLAGVGPGATLVDALQALGDRERPLRLALLAAERAMFGPATERQTAGDEMLAAIQAYSERGAAKRDAWIR